MIFNLEINVDIGTRSECIPDEKVSQTIYQYLWIMINLFCIYLNKIFMNIY